MAGSNSIISYYEKNYCEYNAGSSDLEPFETENFSQEDKYYCRILETDDLSGGYLTVQFLTGNYDWYEFCFRVFDEVSLRFELGEKRVCESEDEGKVAYFTTLTGEDGKDKNSAWVRNEVSKAIHDVHPDLQLRSGYPYQWQK